MGYPDSFQIPVSDTQEYRQFGNSVVVPVVEKLAQAVVKTLHQPLDYRPDFELQLQDQPNKKAAEFKQEVPVRYSVSTQRKPSRKNVVGKEGG